MKGSLSRLGFAPVALGPLLIAAPVASQPALPSASPQPKPHGESPTASASPGAPPELSISLASQSGDGLSVSVRGLASEWYQLSASSNLLHWSSGTPRRADHQGIARFEIPSDGPLSFFRASVARAPLTPRADSPEVRLGQRLFRETRFAQFFHAHSEGDFNVRLAQGDPILDLASTLNDPVPGPFAGETMSCRACHFVGEGTSSPLGQRAYTDFAIRSPIPTRNDGRTLTLRNSPGLVGAMIAPPEGTLLHLDGEFADAPSLVRGTLTGRNFGWLPTEESIALQHIARVIRADDGTAFEGPSGGGAYHRLFLGTDPSIPEPFRLSPDHRLDVFQATDGAIVEAIGRLVEIYLRSLTFARDDQGRYHGSPYDLFLQRNQLPRQPEPGESDLAYARRLRPLVNGLSDPAYVTPADGTFRTHSQPFQFGPTELSGLRIFLTEPGPVPPSTPGGIGNCVICHAPPHFTDFDFHNTGAAQWEYDAVHGEGTFRQVPIPGLSVRNQSPSRFLPPTANHPEAQGLFSALPHREFPDRMDLGLWNVYAHPDLPGPQSVLQDRLARRFGVASAEGLLPRTVALFKTRGLRDLGHSAPYLHTGQASTLEATIFFYRFTAELAQADEVRNADPEMARIFLNLRDTAPLAAFLRSLNEDYE